MPGAGVELSSGAGGAECGLLGALACDAAPRCQSTYVVGPGGLCERCGLVVGAVPCVVAPYCSPDARLIGAIGDAALDSCALCGSMNGPPCGTRSEDQPCDDGLAQQPVTSVASASELAKMAGSVCAAPDGGACGFVGQTACSKTGAECYARSVLSDDGARCVDCGGSGEAACSGTDQQPCNEGLTLGKDGVCSGGGVLSQSATTAAQQDDSCGGLGMPRCEGAGVRECNSRLIAEEGGDCVACGHRDGALPCVPDDLPACDQGLVQIGDFCAACGGEGQPVCCDRAQCGSAGVNYPACNEGLFRTGVEVTTGITLRLATADAYCSAQDLGNRCGLSDQPPVRCPSAAAALAWRYSSRRTQV